MNELAWEGVVILRRAFIFLLRAVVYIFKYIHIRHGADDGENLQQKLLLQHHSRKLGNQQWAGPWEHHQYGEGKENSFLFLL